MSFIKKTDQVLTSAFIKLASFSALCKGVVVQTLLHKCTLMLELLHKVCSDHKNTFQLKQPHVDLHLATSMNVL